MKKGESISMSVIIIAAIALLVLVVLAVLVLRAGSSVGSGTGCSGTGGVCTDDSDTGCGDFAAKDVTKSGIFAKGAGCKEGQICCVPTGKENTE